MAWDEYRITKKYISIRQWAYAAACAMLDPDAQKNHPELKHPSEILDEQFREVYDSGWHAGYDDGYTERGDDN